MPQLTKSVVFEPGRQVVGIQSPKAGLSVHSLYDDDILWSKLVEQQSGLRRDNHLVKGEAREGLHRSFEKISQKSQSIRMEPKLGSSNNIVLGRSG